MCSQFSVFHSKNNFAIFFKLKKSLKNGKKKQCNDLAIDSNSILLLEEEYCAGSKLRFDYQIIKTNIRVT